MRPVAVAFTSRWLERACGSIFGSVRAANTVPGVSKERNSGRVVPGSHHVERAGDRRAREVTQQEYLARVLSSPEINLEAESRIVDQHRLRSGDAAGKHLISGVDQPLRP